MTPGAISFRRVRADEGKGKRETEPEYGDFVVGDGGNDGVVAVGGVVVGIIFGVG